MAGIFDGLDLSGLLGTGASDKKNKSDSKSQKELAKLQGKLQRQLAAQQAQYAQQLEAQRAAASLEQQREQQAYQKPFTEAELTGLYNGTKTLASIQADRQNEQFYANQRQNQSQFEATQKQEKEKMALEKQLRERDQQLAELDEQHRNAISQGNLDLAREIQTKQVALQEQQQKDEMQLKTSELSGYMQNGQLTEQARAQRVQEALQKAQVSGVYVDPDTGETKGYTEAAREFNEQQALKQAQTMGVDASGNRTDAAQQWRSQLGLQYAQMQAQLANNPADYFTAAALQRNANAQDALGFLRDINNGALGSNTGFRAAMTSLPQTNSMQNIAGQVEGPSPSLAVAQNAAFSGAQGAYTTSMNQPAAQPGATTDNINPGQLGNLGGPVMQPGPANQGPVGESQPLNGVDTGGGTVGDARMGGVDARMKGMPDPSGGQGFIPPGFKQAQQQLAIDPNMPVMQKGMPDPSGGRGFVPPFAASEGGGTGGDTRLGVDSAMTNQAYQEPPKGTPDPSGGRGFVPPFAASESGGASGGDARLGGDSAMINQAYQTPGAPKGTPDPSGGRGFVPPAAPPAFNNAQQAFPASTVGPSGQPGPAPKPVYGQSDAPDLAQQRLAAFAPIFQAGAHKLAPGALAAMSPTEKGLFVGAAKASGISPEDFEQSFNRSRLQTNVGAGAI